MAKARIPGTIGSVGIATGDQARSILRALGNSGDLGRMSDRQAISSAKSALVGKSGSMIPFLVQGLNNVNAEIGKQQIASGTTPGTTVETLPRTFEEGQARANSLNEQRFQQGLNLFEEQKQNVSSFGQSTEQRLRQQLTQANAQATQTLIDRGIFNSSAAINAPAINQSNFDLAMLDLQESIARQRNDILSNQIGFIERRTDQATDPALLANLQRSASGALTAGDVSGNRNSGTAGSGQPFSAFGVGSSRQPNASGVRDFSGREVNDFGRLVFRGQDSSRQTQNPTDSLSSQRNQAIKILRDRGVNIPQGISASEMDQRLSQAGIKLNRATDASNLNPTEISRLMNAFGQSRVSR